MPRLWTENPLLAAVYDVECAGRWDHGFYLDLAEELGAHSVVDIGCGTGVFAVDLARRGHQVIGVDPAGPMLDIARQRSALGPTVHWIHGHADDVPTGSADLAVMMGHVAQYFVDDEDWTSALRQIHRIVTHGGRLTFETRNPAIDWAKQWKREKTIATYPHPEGGEFTSWVEVVSVTGAPESYALTHEGHTRFPDGRHLVASETLRFRSEGELLMSLQEAGFD
ncbi:MAG: class I SAM-dependent methyltransferase, partial [Actinomycetia bacterium]|nr:class I SAM-dependent methyltransferase [Actinomycetes bacterium]